MKTLFFVVIASLMVQNAYAGNPLEEIGKVAGGVAQGVEQAVGGIGQAAGAGTLGSSWYRIVNTTTGVCSETENFPGGDIGLNDLKGKYPDPVFTVTYGRCQ